MPIATLRLTSAEKRMFAAEARRRGLTLSEYLRQAAAAEARRADWNTFFAAMPAIILPSRAPADLSSREGFGSSVHPFACSREGAKPRNRAGLSQSNSHIGRVCH
jgi:hypothetical protein